MGRPKNQMELLAAMGHEFERLWAAVDRVELADRERAGACEEWSVKDLMAHLDAWHEMYLGWERAGSAGGKPDMPAPGYSWGDTPALNQAIFERTRDDSWVEVEGRLRDSFERAKAVVASYSDDDLFTKKRYAWTGTTSVGSYSVSATSSHYAWAAKLIRRWIKACD